MLRRYSSRRTDLGKNYLVERLRGAVSYDRIAGYFCSSVLEVAGEAMENVAGKIRIICNSGLTLDDVRTAELAAMKLKDEWSGFNPEDVYKNPAEQARLGRLYKFLSTGKMEIRVLPDEVYGLMHGKAGLITYITGQRVAFIGSMNETKSALTTNYEILWEDDSEESAEWVAEEFKYFWENENAIPLSEFIITDIKRVSKRRVIPLKDWRDDEGSGAGTITAEEPVARKDFGLWPHQKYFIERAFREHKTESGARLLLADMVGLGKTLQLAMAAKLMALYGDKPVLIIVPKTLLNQWQEEIYTMLNIPSAVWHGKFWRDERGYEYPCGIRNCPRRIGIVSQGLITAKSESAEQLKDLKYECVILDEAHRARRKNLNQDANKPAQANNLLKFLREIAYQTHSLLLATATPVQMNPIEAFDLLAALGAEKILGNKYSVWRHTPKTGLEYVSGTLTPPTEEESMWALMRNPFPERSGQDRDVDILRDRLGSDETILPQEMFEGLSNPVKVRIRQLYHDNFVAKYNPYVRFIVRRTREFLERTINDETGEPYLRKIQVELYGEKDNEALELTGYMKEAYETAESLCAMLSSRVKGGGFMSTLLLRRIGSTIKAGENTAKKLLSWSENLPEVLAEEDETSDDDNDIKNLTRAEIECLNKLVNVLNQNRDTDPKYLRVKEILSDGWQEKGCVIFSQYYDSANYIAELLSKDFEEDIGLYAGGDKSGIYQTGIFTRATKNELKTLVTEHKLKILVGTDSASEGLNLQTLGTLINVDLPWNPTRLEQRKGRIQRIGQAHDKIMIYNMRYKDSVEDKVHRKLSKRLQEIYDIFGQIPEVLEDLWVAIAQNDEQRAFEVINKIPRANPFRLNYENKIVNYEWEKSEVVVDKLEKFRALLKGW